MCHTATLLDSTIQNYGCSDVPKQCCTWLHHLPRLRLRVVQQLGISAVGAIIGQYKPWIIARGRNRCSAEWDAST